MRNGGLARTMRVIDGGVYGGYSHLAKWFPGVEVVIIQRAVSRAQIMRVEIREVYDNAARCGGTLAQHSSPEV